MSGEHMQIGEVAERTGLSLRTIRYYGEVGLVTPSARTAGGFRLYCEDDVERLHLIKRMKVLELNLEEMRVLVNLLDERTESPNAEPEADLRGEVEQLQMYREVVESRCEALREQLAQAQTFSARLQQELERRRAQQCR